MLTIFTALSCTGTDQSNSDYTKTPVFLVHGYGMKAESWKPLMSYLMKSGYPRTYLKAIQLRPNNGSNIEAAEQQIAPAIEELLSKTNAFLEEHAPDIPLKTKVDVISHSMGALSARWYAARVRPERVRIWISLGGAHHGTDVLCGWKGFGARDLCPAYAGSRKESAIQYALNGAPYVPDVDETPYGRGKDSPGVDTIPHDDARSILYTSIRTSPDKWIKPEHSAILDGADGIDIPMPKGIQAAETTPGNILMKNGVGHDEMLKDADTMRLVGAVLGLVRR
jgi:pimeloyl-ACP methyl ester carboxylesterase